MDWCANLHRNFNDETVAELSDRLNLIDFQRLDVGLEAAEAVLRAEPEPLKRTQSLLAGKDPTALLALYEALCCVGYHKSDDRLSKHFNYVFEQVQNKKILRIGDTLPAMAEFLFDSNPYRLQFATVAWQRMTTALTTESFDWVVHDVLSKAILRVPNLHVTPEDLCRFWRGFQLILDHMDEKLITHSLKAMEVQPSIFELVLWHLPSDSAEVVGLVVEALRSLMKKSPKGFWDSMRTISPATVAEQIFASAGFEKLLGSLQPFIENGTSPAIAWIPDFIASLPAVHQHDACRSLLHNLLERIQNDRFSEVARLTCCRAGLGALCATLNTFVKSDYKVNPTTSLIVINDILGLVDTYKGTITGFADFSDDDGAHQELKRLGMVVIRDALALDCKALSAEFHTLEEDTPIQRVTRNHSQPIWQAVLDIFRPGNVDLAKSILAATSALIGLDKLWPTNKKTGEIPEDHAHYNKDFKQLNDNVSRIFERLSEFDASDLRQMSQTPQTARPLFAALFSADQDIYEAAVEVMKAMTGHSGKQDAMQSLFDQGLGPVLNSMTYAVTRIRKARTFSPIPYMIKIGQNVLDALCGNTGILRTRSTLSTSDQSAVMTWWTVQWHALDMVFSTTEKWGGQVAHKIEYMQDFCRDAMEYAEALLDQHTIIASAVRESSPLDDDQGSTVFGSSRDSIRKVLEIVCTSVNGLTMMLRLRDSYLISIITRILSKLLRCLGEYELEIDEFASNFIKSACKRENEQGFRRTNLTHQEKAELQRALDEHYGLEVIDMPTPVTVKKQSTIESWTKSGDGKRHEPTLPPKSNDTLNKSASEKSRALMQKFQTSKSAQSVVHNQQFLENRRKAEEEKKRLNAEAIAKAKALRGPATLVKGEGSGLQGIGGVAGKDHTPVRSEIMVGSSDEDSDEDDDDDTNTLLTKRKETSKTVAEYEESRRRALLKQQQGPVRKAKVQRSAKDLRARVEPNMDKLYLEILNWEIFHPGDTPPSNNMCRRIDNSYLDLDLYKRTFGPLLISEVWRSLVTAKDENNFKALEIKVLNRLSVDKFMEISTSMPSTNNRDQSLMSERDIVLLSKGSDPLNDMKEPHCLARVDRTTRKKDVIEITYRVSREINPNLLQCLVPNRKINALKIADMTTTQREFAALSSLEYYDLCNEVLEAKPSPIQRYGGDRVSSISTKYSLNRGQAQAILSATDNDGFTLIQG
jgi:senataxin